MIIKVYLSKNVSFSFFRLYSALSSCKRNGIDHHLKGENGWQFKIYWSLILNYVCLWLHPSSLTSTFFPLWRNIVCTEPIKLTRQGSNSRLCGGLQGGKVFERLALGKARLLWHEKLFYWWSPLLPVHSAICYLAHIYISGWRWWELFCCPLQIIEW